MVPPLGTMGKKMDLFTAMVESRDLFKFYFKPEHLQGGQMAQIQIIGEIGFYPCPLWYCGSSDGLFILLLLFHTSNFLFLLGTEKKWGAWVLGCVCHLVIIKTKKKGFWSLRSDFEIS